MKILGLNGSLRIRSRSGALLRAAGELLPDGVTLTVHALDDLPFFNEDLEAEIPAEVAALAAAVVDADAVLIASPEYNHGLPAVMKNALDWLSRKSTVNAIGGKPVAVVSQSPGAAGGVRMQVHLREVLGAVGARQLPSREFAIGRSMTKFDGDNRLVDERSRESLRKIVAALVEFGSHQFP